jgi:hypothetical protein
MFTMHQTAVLGERFLQYIRDTVQADNTASFSLSHSLTHHWVRQIKVQSWDKKTLRAKDCAQLSAKNSVLHCMEMLN